MNVCLLLPFCVNNIFIHLYFEYFHTTQIEHRANVICQRRANKTACQQNANVGLWNDCYLGNVFQPHFTTSLQRPINEKYRFYDDHS